MESINRSALHAMVKEALVVSVDDAHERVYDYLINSGMDDVGSLLFRQCWTKVYLASQAFGRKDTPVNPILFAEELIKELAANMPDIKVITSITKECVLMSSNGKKKRNEKSGSSVINNAPSNPQAVFNTLKQMSLLGGDINDAYSIAYSNKNNDKSMINNIYNYTEAILAYKRAVKLIKHTNHSSSASKNNKVSSGYSNVVYTPLDKGNYYGYPEVVYGHADLRLHNNRSYCGIEERIATCHVRVSTKQAVYQSRAFHALEFLYEAVVMKSYNIFPWPIGIIRGDNTNNNLVTFVYENPTCRHLGELFSPNLSTYLLLYPSVILHWAQQLGLAYDVIQKKSVGYLFQFTRDLSIKSDVFIRENGTLLLGNLGIVLSPINCARENTSTPAVSYDSFSLFMFNLLSTILGISRSVDVHMAYSSASNALDDDDLGIDETVITVVEGCNIDLIFHNQIVTAYVINGKSKSDKSSTSAPGVMNPMIVNIEGDHGAVHVVDMDSTISSIGMLQNSQIKININAIKPGNTLLRVKSINSKPIRTNSDDSEPLSNTVYSNIRIIVVPQRTTYSVELTELVALLESSYTSKKPLFLAAKCIKYVEPSEKSEEFHQTLHDDWAEVYLKSFDKTKSFKPLMNKIKYSSTNIVSGGSKK